MGAFVNAGAREVATAASVITPDWPASMVIGNTIAVIAVAHAQLNISAPGGWDSSSVNVNSGGGPAITCVVNTHRIDGSESGTGPDFTLDSPADCFATAYQFSGLVASNPIANASGFFGTSNPHEVTGFNTTAANSLVIASDGTFADTVLDTPATWTSRASQGDAGQPSHSTLFDKTVTANGDYSGDISENGASADWVMVQVELLSGAVSAAGYTGMLAFWAGGASSFPAEPPPPVDTGLAGEYIPRRKILQEKPKLDDDDVMEITAIMLTFMLR